MNREVILDALKTSTVKIDLMLVMVHIMVFV